MGSRELKSLAHWWHTDAQLNPHLLEGRRDNKKKIRCVSEVIWESSIAQRARARSGSSFVRAAVATLMSYTATSLDPRDAREIARRN